VVTTTELSFWISVSNQPVQRSAGSGELVDPAGDLGIFDKGRGVMRLEPGIDDQRSATAPVLVLGEGSDAVQIHSWI